MPPRRRLSTTAWVGSTYFAEGFPFVIVRHLAQVYLTDLGLREAHLGFLNFLGIPWNLKFLWAPIVDYRGTKRRWIVAVEILLAAGIAGVALSATGVAAPLASAEGEAAVRAILTLFVLLAFLAATHDIAIDSYYLAALTDRQEQALYTGDRVTAYRVAVIYVKTLLVWAAAAVGWSGAWWLAVATMALLLGGHAWLLPQPEAGAPPRGRESGVSPVVRHFWRAFRTYLDQPRVALVLVFVVTYKLGDEILLSMNTPFLLRELGITKAQLAWVSGFLGTLGLILGSIVSAWWISRSGLRRAIWPLTLMMNLNIWAYVALAAWKPDPSSTAGISWIAAIHGYEMFAAGLGNSVLMVYLMRTCKPEFKAAHFAVGSALMSLGGTLLGGFGGILVERFGYAWFYVIGFLFALPGMALIPWVPHLEETQG